MDKYQHWYNQLIDRARRREHLYEYFERHHIVPCCLGGSDDPSNIAKLTYREHFLAHWLLTKFTKGQERRKMLSALKHMAFFSLEGRRIVSSWQYAVARRAAKNAATGVKLKSSTKAKMSVASKATWNHPQTRARILAAQRAAHGTPESKARKSASQKGRVLPPEVRAKIGRPWSEQRRKEMSDKLRGREFSKEHREKLRVPKSTEHKRRLSVSRTGYKQPKEVSERHSVFMKKLWAERKAQRGGKNV